MPLGRVLRESDLRYLVRQVAPQAHDAARLVRALSEDDDILLGMVRDPRLLRHLLAEPERLVAASPRLFFAVLLVQVQSDLARARYTVEGDERHRAAVFDAPQVRELMGRPDILAYFVEMLVSFLRIRTQTLVVRVRKGVYNRVSYSDTDLESLLDWGRHAGPEERFALWKRIGDVCLFRSGLYPASATRATLEHLREVGRAYYGRASRHEEAEAREVTGTLDALARGFETAVKPLSHLASRYLDALRERIFSLP